MGALSAGGLIGSLTTAASVLKTLDSTFSAIQDFSGGADKDRRAALLAQQNLALQQLQAQQGLSEGNSAQQAALERQKLEADAASSEAARRDALRRAVARQNAQFGSQGMSAGDGSGEAVLLGLFDESDQDRATREKMDNLRLQAIDQDLQEESRINVLQRTQMQERQRLERALSDY